MKKVTFSIFLIAGISYGVTLDQFTDFTRKKFETKFNRVHHRLQIEGIDTESGLAQVYSSLRSKKLEEAFEDQNASNCMNTLYDEIKQSPEFTAIVERLKQAKTEDSFERESYAYWLLVIEKAQSMLTQNCPGIAFVKPFPVEDTREWMMVDYPEYYRLNQNKTFDENCSSCVLGVNAIISLMAQEMYQMVKE